MSANARFERDFLNTETLNLAELHAHSLLYTPREARFDRITRLAARALGVPVATIGLIQDGQLWFKSVVGWQQGQMPAEGTFCDYVVAADQIMIVEDATQDERFQNSPLVVREPSFRFYAGVPLRGVGDVAVGTLALFDTEPRTRTPAMLQILRDLGGIAQKELLTTDLRNTQTQWVRRLSVDRRRASLDPVTRLWNQRVGLELASGTLAQASDENRSVGLGVLGLEFGAEVQPRQIDPTLRHAAELLVSCLRSQDIVCRGDAAEFIVIVDGANQARLREVAKRFFQRLTEGRAETPEQASYQLNFGGAVCGPADRESAEVLLRRARRALEAGRERGPKGIAIAGPRSEVADRR
jgi:diguanylate cyclase (GGDEF)-like protein